MKSEARVKRTMEVIKFDFINPFSPDIDPNKLFNIVSGKPLPRDVAEDLLSTYSSLLSVPILNPKMMEEQSTFSIQYKERHGEVFKRVQKG